MLLKPRKGFSFIVKFIDFFNPVIVLLSIAGLILEYTEYKEYVLYPNRIIDMIFVVDFLLRLVSFPSGRYFFKAYGWVDFLASIPGFTAFMQFGQYFGLFKVMRIGRFFKIIRVLRFLRIFSFLKKMKGDSAFIQERIMKIGVTIVIVFVTGLGFTDYFITDSFMELKKDNLRTVMELSRNKVSKLAERTDNVIYYSDNSFLYDADGKAVKTYSDYTEKIHSPERWYVELRFSDSSADYEGNMIPIEGIMVSADDIMKKHDSIMLILISSLILILLILIFYIGYIFAKDIKIVQLINDSVDADDYWLLKEEAKKYSSKGEFVIEEGEDEIISLIKMAARLAEKAESDPGLTGLGSGMYTDAGFSSGFSHDIDGGSVSAPNPEAGESSDAFQSEVESREIPLDNVMSMDVSDSEAELSEFSDIMPDLSGFADGETDNVPVIGDERGLYIEDDKFSADEFNSASVEDASYISAEEDGTADTAVKIPGYKAAQPETLQTKLDLIEKTVKEINSKISSLGSIQGQALETVARDAASRAVKITSKSIGEYIHRKLAGR